MRRPALLVVCLAVFVDMLGFGIILPSLPFQAAHLGGSGLWVGALLTAYAAAQFVAAPVLGSLSDRFGRRRLLLLALAGSMISLALTGLASTLVLLLLARLVAGAFGGAIAVAQAYVVDLTGNEDRTRALGLVGASIGLGFVFGPAIGAGLTGIGLGFGAVSYVAAGVAAINLVLGLAWLPRTAAAPAETAEAPPAAIEATGTAGTAGAKTAGAKTAVVQTAGVQTAGMQAVEVQTGGMQAGGLRTAGPQTAEVPTAAVVANDGVGRGPVHRLGTLRDSLRRRSLRPILLAVFAVTFAFAGMETTFALLGAQRFGLTPAGLGAVFACLGVIMVAVQGGLVGRLTGRYGERVVAVAGALLMATGLVLLPFVPAWVGYPALAAVAMGQGLLSTTTAALIARAGGRRVGGAFGVGQSASAAARAIGPLVAGAAFDLGAALPYVLGALLSLAAAALLSSWRLATTNARFADVPATGTSVNDIAPGDDLIPVDASHPVAATTQA